MRATGSLYSINKNLGIGKTGDGYLYTNFTGPSDMPAEFPTQTFVKAINYSQNSNEISALLGDAINFVTEYRRQEAEHNSKRDWADAGVAKYRAEQAEKVRNALQEKLASLQPAASTPPPSGDDTTPPAETTASTPEKGMSTAALFSWVIGISAGIGVVIVAIKYFRNKGKN